MTESTQAGLQGGAASFMPGAVPMPIPPIHFPGPSYTGPQIIPGDHGYGGGGLLGSPGLLTPSFPPPDLLIPGQMPSNFRGYGRKQPNKTFEAGSIIAVPYHTIDFRQPPQIPTRDETLTRLGWVHTKERRLIIIDCFNDHCVAIPMATHNNNGLRLKKAKGEWVGVRDAADPEPAESESVHGNISATRDNRFRLPDTPVNQWWTKHTTYAHFSSPIAFPYDRGCIHLGKIAKPEDLKKLRELYYRRCPKPHYARTVGVGKNEQGEEEGVGRGGEERDWWKAAIEQRQKRVKDGTASTSAPASASSLASISTALASALT
ncbi:hypothetical protein BKA65DRAFT_555246 [Rhexocercosporidium sp. MPI-PUGE-AT-0058]|nr:hypothetical protein BKA65DRAFT_555246 [Rhexocercosporidium sp. MPI-PUGE-AT-0058]